MDPNVFWPPSYYILRDRIPFYLTLVYLYRHKFSNRQQLALTDFLLLLDVMFLASSLTLWIMVGEMTPVFGIHWSSPSPIEWTTCILLGYAILKRNGIDPLSSLYLSFLSAMGGAWLYDALSWWLPSGTWFSFFKINAVKVFFVEYQVLCLPIVAYLIYKQYKFKRTKWFIPSLVLLTVFYYYAPELKPLIRLQIGKGVYKWLIRVPVILSLLSLFQGVTPRSSLE